MTITRATITMKQPKAVTKWARLRFVPNKQPRATMHTGFLGGTWELRSGYKGTGKLLQSVEVPANSAPEYMDVARTKCGAYHSGGLIRYRVLSGKEGL